MTERQEKSLFKSYSHLFLDFDNLSFNFGRGWYNLITELCRTLDLYISIYPKNDLSRFKIVSLKQKFGCLEIESINSTKEIDTILQATSILAYKTCEKCGKIGNLYCSTKWLHWSNKKILCQTHAVELYYYSLNS